MTKLSPPPAGALEGRTAVVTGASSGIGRAMAESFARLGADVVTVSRASGDGAAAAEAANRSLGRDAVHFVPGDLSTADGARDAAAAVRDVANGIDVLANNAGAFFARRETNDDGLELTFALNHLGAFVFGLELAPTLIESGAPERPARILATSSAAASFGRIHWEDPLLERSYGGWKAYAQSKLANLLFTFELARRLGDAPVVAHAFHPGFVRSRFGDGDGLMSRMFGLGKRLFGRPPERGARTGVRLATDDAAADVSGAYWSDEAPTDPPRQAQEAQAQARLWDLSLRLAGFGRDPLEARASEEVAA